MQKNTEFYSSRKPTIMAMTVEWMDKRTYGPFSKYVPIQKTLILEG